MKNVSILIISTVHQYLHVILCVQVFQKDWESVGSWRLRERQLTRRRKVHGPIGRYHEQAPDIPVQVHIASNISSSPAIRIATGRPSLIKHLFDLGSGICRIALILSSCGERILHRQTCILVEAWEAVFVHCVLVLRTTRIGRDTGSCCRWCSLSQSSF